MAFVIGDNQYGYERAFDLLIKECFIDVKNDRVEKQIPVVHVGDNGDYYRGTELRDQKSWEVLPEYFDEMLIGNHEAYVLFGMELGGGWMPNYICKGLIEKAFDSGKLKFATSHDGFLITHAGVHPSFEDDLPDDPVEAAKYLNDLGAENPHAQIFSYIGAIRGGWQGYGGIFWRDVSEPISDKWPQIFGHSRMPLVTAFGKEDSKDDPDYHYAIDVGYPNNGRIAGLYTDSRKVVEVNIND